MSKVLKQKSQSQSQSPSGASTMDVAGALTAIDQVLAALALTPQPPLTVKQRKAATRSRKGMEKVIPTLATLSVEHGVSVPKQPTSAMTANLELVAQLEPVLQKLGSLVTLVTETLGAARSESWITATTLYGMLVTAAHRDSQLKSQLAPVEAFFKYRHPSVKKNHPKQKAKKAALKAEQQATAQAAAESSAAETHSTSSEPSNDSATASTNANAPSSVVAPHVA